MPVRTANIGDTVQLRDAKGKTRNVTVVGTQANTGTVPGTPVVANSGAGGTLTAATYSYKISRIKNGAESAASAVAGTTVVAGGTTNKCTITLPGVAGEQYGVYGRVGGSELLIGISAAGASSFDDTGAVTPAGALPTADSRVAAYSHHQNRTAGAAGGTKLTKATAVADTNVYFKY
jgi:hypothetical protein